MKAGVFFAMFFVGSFLQYIAFDWMRDVPERSTVHAAGTALVALAVFFAVMGGFAS